MEIAVLLYPLLKCHGEALALAHVGFRVTELAASLFYLAVPLLVIQLHRRSQHPRGQRLTERSLGICDVLDQLSTLLDQQQ